MIITGAGTLITEDTTVTTTTSDTAVTTHGIQVTDGLHTITATMTMWQLPAEGEVTAQCQEVHPPVLTAEANPDMHLPEQHTTGAVPRQLNRYHRPAPQASAQGDHHRKPVR